MANIRSLYNLLELELKGLPGSRAASLAITNLQQSEMWYDNSIGRWASAAEPGLPVLDAYTLEQAMQEAMRAFSPPRLVDRFILQVHPSLEDSAHSLLSEIIQHAKTNTGEDIVSRLQITVAPFQNEGEWRLVTIY